MRLLLGLGILILIFAALARMVPAELALPLYIVFVIVTIAFTGWERRRIAKRRRELENQLRQQRLDPGPTFKGPQGDREGP